MTRYTVDGGVYDIGVGVPDLAGAIRYWSAFGYREGERGRLSSEESLRLYGVDSELESVRLFHQQARQGLIRLMRWASPVGPGLNMAPLRTLGTRWSVHRTDDLLTVYSHAEILRRKGEPIALLGPVINPRLGRSSSEQRPFEEPVRCTYNLQMFRPHYQQVVMQRQNIEAETYGTIARNSLLRCSEACHVAVVVPEGREDVPAFYREVLGLRVSARVDLEWNPASVATVMFDLQPGEGLSEIDLDDPLSVSGAMPPGRLRIFLLRTKVQPRDATSCAGPGNLGYSLYTYRACRIEALYAQVHASAAMHPSPILHDEFGRRSFCFKAPDGYFWQISSP